MEKRLIKEAKKRISDLDPSHDFNHAMRVLVNARLIANVEGGDLEVIIPAALFHDLVVYPKNSQMSKNSAAESARIAKEILKGSDYPKEKIQKVEQAIKEHSFSNGLKAKSKESKIIQDADKLEIAGAIAIMRTFCSTGQMRRQFYDSSDPFCENRILNKDYAIDYVLKRVLNISKFMNTKTGKNMAEKRTEFIRLFLHQLRKELMINKKSG